MKRNIMSATSWLTVALLVASILLALVSCDNSNSNNNNNEQKTNGQPNKRPFFVMSRYGRSQYHGGKGRELSVVPRNDRFFLGSRYGKRSQELYPDILEQEASYEDNTNMNMNNNNNNNINGPQMHVSCIYTGITNLYRCTNINGQPDNNNSIDGMTTDDTQK